MTIADSPGRRAGRKVDPGLIGQQRGDRIQHPDVDELALSGASAREQRQQHALRREHAGDDIANRHAETEGGAVGRSRNTHQPAFGLNHRVVPGFMRPGTGLTEAGNGTHDQLRMLRCERCVVEPDPGQRARPEILDHHVALRDQPVENRAPFRILEVEGDAFLVPVDAEKVRAFAADERRAPAAGVVALPRLFDLDDAGAHVRENHRAVRPREHAGQIENGSAFKWLHDRQELYPVLKRWLLPGQEPPGLSRSLRAGS